MILENHLSVSYKSVTDCNRFVKKNIPMCDAEVQTKIHEHSEIIKILNRKKFKSVACGTEKITYEDKSVGNIYDDTHYIGSSFYGIDSVKKELLDLSSVTFNTFNLLLSVVKTKTQENWKVPKKIDFSYF